MIKRFLPYFLCLMLAAGGAFAYTWDSADVTADMTANNAPSPNVVSASSEYSGSYPAWQAFDHTGDYWRTQDPDSLPEWIKFDFGSGQTYAITGYKITNWPTDSNYSPTAWQVHGSNDDSGWTLLDSQAAVSWSSGDQTKSYSFSNTTQFRYYRFTFSAVNAGTSLRVGEIELFGSAPLIPSNPYIF